MITNQERTNPLKCKTRHAGADRLETGPAHRQTDQGHRPGNPHQMSESPAWHQGPSGTWWSGTRPRDTWSEAGVMSDQVAHVYFVTNDLEKIIDLYVDRQGMRVKFTLDNREGQPFGYYFECGNSTYLEFFDQAMAAEVWGGNVTELTSGTRYKHFCLEVIGLDEFCRELKNRGVSVSDISMGMDNSRQAWISDPDGNQIELMEYGPASLQLTGKLTA